MSAARLASTCRGAGVFDYAIVLAMVGGVALVAANAFAKAPERTLRNESECVKTLTCERSRAVSGSPSLVPEERGRATEVWDGVRTEANVAVSELEAGVRSPRDVVRGVAFIVDHPGLAAKAMLTRNAGRPPEAGAPVAGGAEQAGQDAARVATAISPAGLGRIAKIGAMVARRGTIAWELPPAPAGPVDPLAEGAPSPGAGPAAGATP